MTDRIALVLAILILAAFAADHFYFHFGLLVFLGRKLTAFVDFLQFWR